MKKANLFNKQILLFSSLAILGLGFFYRVTIKEVVGAVIRKSNLPAPQAAPKFEAVGKQRSPIGVQAKESKRAPLPPAINLAVPFASQAPYQVWDAVHEETCEEAAILMADGFHKGVKKFSPAAVEKNLLALVDYQNQTLGFFEDTDAAQTAQILRDYFGYKSVVVTYDIGLADIKKELAAGHPVIVPAAGKLLGNPYFTGGGPVYHMLVIKGYTKDGRFIANDPGTRRGADYLYKFDALYNAINDWDSQNHDLSGRKAMIVIH